MDKKALLRAIVDTYEDIQKERIRAENRLRSIVKGMDENDPLRIEILKRLTQFKELEGAIEKDALNALKGIPVYEEFLKKVKGIGTIYSIKLLALPLKLGVSLSAWNAYFGLTPHYYVCQCEKGHKFLYSKEVTRCPIKGCGALITQLEHIEEAPRRKKGYYSFWNPKARALAYLISRNFVMLGERGFYGRMYRKFKKRILQRKDIEHYPQIRKEAMARRLTFKLFLAHFYQAYHELEYKASYRMPYQFEYLKHTDFISWREVIELGG